MVVNTLDLQHKVAQLRRIIAAFPGVTVAFSGGTDSSYLLAVCIDVLGPERVVAVTADSPFLPRAELGIARQVAKALGAQHQVLRFDELARPEIVENSPQRCYHCKRARFELLLELSECTNASVLVDGENADDQHDFRPGTRAARELGVRAPLAEAGLTKVEIRQLSCDRGLETWDLPAAACLASRFPYGIALTRDGLARVEHAENLVRQLTGIRQLRVRDHHELARIEVPAAEISRLAADSLRSAIASGLRQMGYRYVSLDLDGYRMGSLNEVIATDQEQSTSQ